METCWKPLKMVFSGVVTVGYAHYHSYWHIDEVYGEKIAMGTMGQDWARKGYLFLKLKWRACR